MSTTKAQIEIDVDMNMSDGRGQPITVFAWWKYYASQSAKDKGNTSGYSQCVKDRWPSGGTSGDNTSTDFALGCSTKGDGDCWDSNSKWALYLYLNDDYIQHQAQIGHVHFHEVWGGDWTIEEVATYDTHMFTVDAKMDKDTGSLNKGKITIALKSNIAASYCTGSTTNLSSSADPVPCLLPSDYSVMNICSVGMDSDNTCYYWYYDGRVSRGAMSNSSNVGAPELFSLPTGYDTKDIVGMDIGTLGKCYVWFSDLTVWSGEYRDIRTNEGTLILPEGQSIQNVRGIAITPAQSVEDGDTCTYWFLNGQCCSGTATNAAASSGLKSYSLPDTWTTMDIRGISIEGNGSTVVTWLAL
jgi:hypothetical protein